MNNNKIISMIDEYLTEPHSISREWVQALLVCKDALVQNKKKDTEIDILIRKKEALRDEISEKKAEIERLQKAIKVQDIMIEQQDYKLKQAKAEARKEFWERLKQKKCAKGSRVICIERGDEFLKEMEGENNV